MSKDVAIFSLGSTVSASDSPSRHLRQNIVRLGSSMRPVKVLLYVDIWYSIWIYAIIQQSANMAEEAAIELKQGVQNFDL